MQGYSQGGTPNPCLVCNQIMKWGYLYEQARNLGADFIATGHYARVARGESGQAELLRGRDRYKDQAYFLSVLTQEQLAHTLFPLGEYYKHEVRELAYKMGLVTASRSDSMDLCFLGNEDYRDFLSRYAPETINPGPIVNLQGETIGVHRGLAFYTIGQRKGLDVPSEIPLYVIEKDLAGNRLVVGEEEALGSNALTAEKINWISGHAPEEDVRVQAKIRYRSGWPGVG